MWGSLKRGVYLCTALYTCMCSEFNFRLSSFYLYNFASLSGPSLCQSVVNLISELQEQMCRIQEELSCKIQEKKAAEIQEDGDTDTSASLNHSAEAEETSAGDPSSGDLGAEELCHCGRESVGTERT